MMADIMTSGAEALIQSGMHTLKIINIYEIKLWINFDYTLNSLFDESLDLELWQLLIMTRHLYPYLWFNDLWSWSEIHLIS